MSSVRPVLRCLSSLWRIPLWRGGRVRCWRLGLKCTVGEREHPSVRPNPGAKMLHQNDLEKESARVTLVIALWLLRPTMTGCSETFDVSSSVQPLEAGEGKTFLGMTSLHTRRAGENPKLQSPERCCGKGVSHQESTRKHSLR